MPLPADYFMAHRGLPLLQSPSVLSARHSHSTFHTVRFAIPHDGHISSEVSASPKRTTYPRAPTTRHNRQPNPTQGLEPATAFHRTADNARSCLTSWLSDRHGKHKPRCANWRGDFWDTVTPGDTWLIARRALRRKERAAKYQPYVRLLLRGKNCASPMPECRCCVVLWKKSVVVWCSVVLLSTTAPTGMGARPFLMDPDVRGRDQNGRCRSQNGQQWARAHFRW